MNFITGEKASMSSFARDAARLIGWERATPEYTPAQRRLVARYVEAARRRLRLARDLAPPSPPLVSAMLLRDAIALLARSVIAGREADVDAATLAGRDTMTLLQAVRAAAGRPADADSRRIDLAIASKDPLYFDALDEGELMLVHGALKREAAWLRRQIDLRSTANIRGTLLGRMAAAFLVVLYLAGCLVGKALGPKNLALGKPVRVSSQQPGTPDPSGLVDGKKIETYGLHTDVSGQNPWALVDLLREENIRKIVVYNRGDMNLNDGLPYALDLSLDGQQFHEIARRDTPFGDGGFLSSPWTAKVRERARYVRIRANGYIALNEIEVF
jgi:hypothetical protein